MSVLVPPSGASDTYGAERHHTPGVNTNCHLHGYTARGIDWTLWHRLTIEYLKVRAVCRVNPDGDELRCNA